jgi:3-isopropylmalate/(R)-2-methylmalate dehydratase large subunit
MGAGKLLIKVPHSIKFNVDGELQKGVSAKDIILKIIGDIGVDGATYRAMEFTGSAIDALSVEERMTICNMAIEAGGKNGIIAPDEKTLEYVKGKTSRPFECFKSDPDAEYKAVYNYDASDFEPVVAMPYSPDNVFSIDNVEDKKIDRAYIGSCTGGKITDFIFAAEILKNNKVSVDTYIIPSTVEVEKALANLRVDGRSLSKIFRDAGCLEQGPPSCAACLGGPVDTYGRCNNSEVCVSTTNRNFPGRMGSKDSKTILASPYTAAASAVRGVITDPREFL